MSVTSSKTLCTDDSILEGGGALKDKSDKYSIISVFLASIIMSSCSNVTNLNGIVTLDSIDNDVTVLNMKEVPH